MRGEGLSALAGTTRRTAIDATEWGRATSRRRDNVQRIHARLREAILEGRFEPGQELSQVKLATSLGVSRGPVREALRLLEREGLIHAEPNRRVVVALLSWTDVEQLYALRITTDSLALRGGVAQFTQEDFEELERKLDALEGLDDPATRETPHKHFHQLLTSRGGQRLARASAQLFDHAERYRRAYLRQEQADCATADREHRAIVDACKARDADAAIEQLARHLSRTVLTVLATYAPTHDPMLVRAALVAMTREPGIPVGAS